MENENIVDVVLANGEVLKNVDLDVVALELLVPVDVLREVLEKHNIVI